MRILTKDDVQDYTIGSTILSTGGGGVAPSLEAVGKMVDRVHDAGKKIKLITLDEVPDEAIIFSHIGTGGGVQSEKIGAGAVIAEQQKQAFVEGGRTAVAPLIAERTVLQAEVMFPEFTAGEIEGDDLAVAEPGVNPVAVRNWRGCGQVMFFV